jgi:TPR repeat protein
LRWYRKAADQGNADAQNNLGVAYYNGKGVAQDYALAARWYRKAADQGLGHAQRNLGAAYSKGEGVPLNHAEAYFWKSVAATLDKNSKADALAKLRGEASAKLSAAELSATEERCRRWIEAFERR